jgi:hypothetical protein
MREPVPTPQWLTALRSHVGAPAATPRTAPDPVNVPMIRRWCEAMGETSRLYRDQASAQRPNGQGVIAPPAMLEVWTMGRYRADGKRERGNLLGIDELDAAGFTSVVATNLEQTYLRDLQPGDLLTEQVLLESVSDEKRTALGVGHFLDYSYRFTDQHGALVGTMRFRILKFRAAAQSTARAAPAVAAPQRPPHPRPAITRDSAFFWDGLRERRLLLRKCARCAHLHHPPGPMCPRCHSMEWETQAASGRGTIHSFVIVHQPQLPGFDYPLPVALIDLEEGVRLVANLAGISAAQARIGLPVEVQFLEVEPGYILYAFGPRHSS